VEKKRNVSMNIVR